MEETGQERTTLTEALSKDFNTQKYSSLNKIPQRLYERTHKVWPLSTVRMEDSKLEAEHNSQGTACVPWWQLVHLTTVDEMQNFHHDTTSL